MMNIDPKRWHQVESLLDEALDLDPAERVAHVHRSAAGDGWLVEQVLRLLAASEKAGSFLENAQRPDLEQVLVQMTSAVDEDPAAQLNPEQAGPYRLLRRLGRGGMGQVYLGVRDDEAFKRFVAVKVIRRGMDTEDILKRFRVERRILASLNHPGIAQLFDGGATEEGESYFVMEYVDGRLDEAERYYDLVVDAFDASGPTTARHVMDLIDLARVHIQNGRRQAAEGHLAAAERWLAENPDAELSAQIDAVRGS